jgi:predicted RNA-binding Zn-ribbon protein involved in translation (DUF1610 family)
MVKKERALTRFQCGHCGSRLVMQNRHLDRLVACHACGRATHPIAGRLAGVAGAAAPEKKGGKGGSPKGRQQAAAAGCANCGQAIGKLQVRRLWHDETVCQPCYTKLAAEMPVSGPAVAGKAASTAVTPAAAPRAVAVAAAPVRRPARVGPPPPVSSVSPAPPAAAAEVPVLELSVAPLAPVLLVGAACFGFFVALSVMSYAGGLVAALVLVGGAALGVRWLRRGTSSVRARFEQVAALRRRHGTSHVLAMLVAWFRAQPAGRLPYALLLLLFWGAMYVPYRLGSLLQSPRANSPARLSA